MISFAEDKNTSAEWLFKELTKDTNMVYGPEALDSINSIKAAMNPTAGRAREAEGMERQIMNGISPASYGQSGSYKPGADSFSGVMSSGTSFVKDWGGGDFAAPKLDSFLEGKYDDRIQGALTKLGSKGTSTLTGKILSGLTKQLGFDPATSFLTTLIGSRFAGKFTEAQIKDQAFDWGGAIQDALASTVGLFTFGPAGAFVAPKLVNLVQSGYHWLQNETGPTAMHKQGGYLGLGIGNPNSYTFGAGGGGRGFGGGSGSTHGFGANPGTI